MKGYVFLEPDAIDMDEDLAYWIQLCLDFNPLAKASKKKARRAVEKKNVRVGRNTRTITKGFRNGWLMKILALKEVFLFLIQGKFKLLA